MACPYQNETNKVEELGETSLTYGDYLHVEKLLSCVKPVSKNHAGDSFHDEHLFIVTHQTYELWFKQIIFEIDSVRQSFHVPLMDERWMLQLVNRLNRVVLILKLLVDQIMVLETMTALDFMEFRKFLEPASGFQSLQFRLIENKLGVKDENRIKYNQQHYKNVFRNSTQMTELDKSVEEPSLVELVQRWLERTPGMNDPNFSFWDMYESAVREWLNEDFLQPAQEAETERLKEIRMAEYKKQMNAFEDIFQEEIYRRQLHRGERIFSHDALKGALMIFMYRDEPRFSQPFQVLQLLMDIDSLMIKWRHNHVMLVQRMIGSKVGTGGSSGYLYLRSTVSERYMAFTDLFKLSTYMPPRYKIPKLPSSCQRKLSVMSIDDDIVKVLNGTDALK